MKTQVIMQRKLLGGEIRQKSKSEFLSATDLVKVGNTFRRTMGLNDFNLSQYLKQKGTTEFIEELFRVKNVNPIQKGRGRNNGTWVHPLLFIDIALAINPKLKVNVYEWLFDQLIKHRVDSGDSYKRMSGALFAIFKEKRKFMPFVMKTAKHIKVNLCGVTDGWERASIDQLKLRDEYHNSIELMCNVMTHPKECVNLGIIAVNRSRRKRIKN